MEPEVWSSAVVLPSAHQFEGSWDRPVPKKAIWANLVDIPAWLPSGDRKAISAVVGDHSTELGLHRILRPSETELANRSEASALRSSLEGLAPSSRMIPSKYCEQIDPFLLLQLSSLHIVNIIIKQTTNINAANL